MTLCRSTSYLSRNVRPGPHHDTTPAMSMPSWLATQISPAIAAAPRLARRNGAIRFGSPPTETCVMASASAIFTLHAWRSYFHCRRLSSKPTILKCRNTGLCNKIQLHFWRSIVTVSDAPTIERFTGMYKRVGFVSRRTRIVDISCNRWLVRDIVRKADPLMSLSLLAQDC